MYNRELVKQISHVMKYHTTIKKSYYKSSPYNKFKKETTK